MEFTGERLIPDDPAHRDLYWEHRARYELAVPLARGKRVLDLGCGCGYGSDLLARAEAKSVVGLDCASKAISYAQTHYQGDALSFVVGDACNSGLPAASFDLIVCYELIEHLADQAGLLTEAARLLAPGGIIFLSTPDAERCGAEPNPFHVRELKRAEFEALLVPRFPHVRLLGQRRLSGVMFGDGLAATFTAADCDYWIAVCGEQVPEVGRLIEIPYWQNLDDLRRRLDERDADVVARDERIVSLQREVEEKSAWGTSLAAKISGLERDRQDRDVRLVLLERQRDEARASIGYRIQRWLEPCLSRFKRATVGIAKAIAFFAIALWQTLLSLPRWPSFVARVAWAAYAFRVGARLRGLLLKHQPHGRPMERQPSPHDGEPPGMSVVVPTYQGRELLARYLPSILLEAKSCPFPTEVLVVDDGSTDGTVEWLATAQPDVRVLHLETNQGFGAAANAGVKAARHPLVYLCNSDMEILPDALRQVAQTLWCKGAFAVASAIEMQDARRAGIETGLVNGTWNHGLLNVYHCGELGDRPRSTLYAGGGASAFDRDAFLALGGFDPLFAPFYAEDLDLSWRAWKAGMTVLIEPRSRVIHQHRGTISRVVTRAAAEQTLSANLLLAQWANLTSDQLLERHCENLWRHVLGGRLTGRAIRSAWQKRDELRQARERRIPSTADECDLIEGAGSFAWDLRFATPRERETDQRLKVLAIAPYCPYPPTHGGAVRMWELLTRLAVRHEVHLAAMVEREQELANVEELKRYFPRVHLRLRGRPDPAPHWWPASVAEFKDESFERAIDRMCGEEDYDLVQVEYPILAHTLPRFGRAKRVITEIDVYHVSYRRAIAFAESFGRKVLSTYEWLRMFRYETEQADRADLLLAMSEVDAAACRDTTDTPTVVVPNGVDTARINFARRIEAPNELLFVGNFRHPPNVEGIRWFVKEVWPLVRDENWRARLLIVGGQPPPEVEMLVHDPTVTVAGFVPDLAPLYARAAVFVSPILRGSGTRLKILEAMAAGVPVVSTTLGAEGLAVRNDEHLLLADRPVDLARACLALLHNAGLRDRLAHAARDLVEREYAWDRIAERLDLAWREVVR